MIKSMDKESTEWPMETIITANGKIIREMVKELVKRLMEKFMRDIGKTTKKTEMENY